MNSSSEGGVKKLEEKAIHARVDLSESDPLYGTFVEIQKEFGLVSYTEVMRHLIAEWGKGKMRTKILIERIGNLASLAEMRKAKAELDRSGQAKSFEGARDALNQVLSILQMEAD